MRSVKIGELKAHLSKYLRLVRAGEQIRVLDRDEPIAVIGPSKVAIGKYLERMANQGRVRLGTQDFSSWKRVERPRLKQQIPLSGILNDLRAIGGD